MFTRLSRKGLSLFLLGILGFANTASVDARLIFTTEGDGTLIDQDLDGDSNFSLFFGTNLGEEIEFDTANDRFNISNDIQVTGNVTATGNVNAVDANFTGNADVDGTFNADGAATLQSTLNVTGATTLQNTLNGQGAVDFDSTLNVDGTTSLGADVTLNNDAQIINLRAQNAATAGAPVCTDASDLGRIYYDTDTEALLFCKETAPSTFAWTSTSSTSGSASKTFYAEFANFSVWADGAANTGTLVAEYDNTDDRSYYLWSTRQGSTQDYDLVMQWQVPSNFLEFDSGASNHLQFDIETVGGAGSIDLRDVQVNGADQSISDTANTAVSWTTQDVDLSGATVSAGDTLTLRFTLFGDSTSTAALSNVKINYTQQ